jgi:hypothetical protein
VVIKCLIITLQNTLPYKCSTISALDDDLGLQFDYQKVLTFYLKLSSLELPDQVSCTRYRGVKVIIKCFDILLQTSLA